MTHKLKGIGYEYDALEPFIDRETMEIHHTKHHQTYVDKLNETLKNHEELTGVKIQDLLEKSEKLPSDIKKNVIFFGGGVNNHDFFWQILKKDVELSGEIEKALLIRYKSFETFKEEFTKMAMKLQGSGWTWLTIKNNKFEIVNTKNQDNPILNGRVPIIGLDMWEHAYYLKYKNQKLDYINNFFKIINWRKVDSNFKKARKI